MRRSGCVLAAALASACAALPARPPVAPRIAAGAGAAGMPAHVVLITVAGLTPDRYLEGDAMPTLSALARRGVAAEHVEPVGPAAAYPAHATLVTGLPPAEHGIVADALLGERGVRRAAPNHASQLRAPALWQRVAEAGATVVALDWPTTTGADVASLLPDVSPVRAGESWAALAAGGATAWIAERVRTAPAGAATPGAERDALLVDLACDAFARSPRLVLLRLRGAEPAAITGGPGSDAAAAAFSTLDGELARLLRCAEEAGVLAQAAFVVAGDRAFAPAHTAVRPNVWLSEAGWITPQGRWKALVRSNGSSGFVYANEARTALDVRERLDARARETGAFRVVSAEEMIARGADPDAWFGLQAEPGFVFENDIAGAPLAPAAARGAAGSLARERAPGVGLVAFGRGVRSEVVVPHMTQLDVAPTLAALLGVRLEAATGRTLVGLLRTSPGPRGASRGR